MKEVGNLVLVLVLLAVFAHFVVHAASPKIMPTAARKSETFVIKSDLQQWLS